MVEAERDGKLRGKAPEIAVLSDCYQQFAHEGLQRSVLDAACTGVQATTMLAEMSPLNQIEILQPLSAHTSVEAAFERSCRNGAPVWGLHRLHPLGGGHSSFLPVGRALTGLVTWSWLKGLWMSASPLVSKSWPCTV